MNNLDHSFSGLEQESSSFLDFEEILAQMKAEREAGKIPPHSVSWAKAIELAEENATLVEVGLSSR